MDEIKELRGYYKAQQYNAMQKHIQRLMQKYWVETLDWNAVNRNQPISYEQAYNNAERFLRAKGINILADKGIKNSIQ